MRLRTLSIGAAVPRQNLHGRVHSVFDRACNLRLLDGALITLLASTLPNAPQGVRLETPDTFDFPSARVRPGQAVASRDDLVTVLGSVLAFDLKSARPWDSDLSRLRVDFSRPDVSAAWVLAAHELDGYVPMDGTRGLGVILHPNGVPAPNASSDLALARGACPSIMDLARAIKHSDLPAAVGPIRTLVGLGPGLTPSGDDFLVGYLAGLWAAAGDARERLEFLSGLASRILSLAYRTNEISRTHLQHATAARVSEPLYELARAIAGARADVSCATRNALRVGHHSGADGVTGLLLGLRAW